MINSMARVFFKSIRKAYLRLLEAEVKVMEAAAAAVCTMGLAGEIGWGNMAEGDGNSTYRNRIIDAIFNMDGETLEKGARYEER